VTSFEHLRIKTGSNQNLYMKKLLILLSVPLLLLFSCGGKNTYTMETFYSSNKDDSDTTLTSEKDNISADTDSVALVKAQEKYNALLGKEGDKHGMPVKFTLRDHNGVIVVRPEHDSMQVEKQMYPAQKPSTGN
jgi:hypothetical protein